MAAPRSPAGPEAAKPASRRVMERHARVLNAVAESYIRTAHPVPSQHVADRLEVSSATVRNDFGLLEEGGLLQQPHTSAGRIPTAEGFRYYASNYLPPRRLPRGDREAIKRELGAVGGDELFVEATRLASRLSGYAVVVRLPPDDSARVLEIHLSLVTSRRLLAVVVLENGLVRQLGVEVDPTPSDSVIDDAERNLRQLGLSVGEAPSALRAAAATAEEELGRTLAAVADAWLGLRSPRRFSDGLSRLLGEPEGDDPSFVRLAVELVEGEPRRVTAPERELELELDERLALVSASFDIAGGRGALTLVGPARMRYPQALAIAREFGVALSSQEGAPVG